MSANRHAFEADQLERLLTKLGQLAASQGVTLELTIAGGAAMALGLGVRRSTHDVDVVQVAPSRATLLELAGELATAEGIAPSWISDDAARFAPTVSTGPVVHESLGILVRSVSDEQLLAMKLDAMRDDVDRADAVAVAVRLGFDQVSTELAIAPYVPHDRYKRACYELDDLWPEVEHAR